MKKIVSIIFSILMIAICSVAGGVLLTGSGAKEDGFDNGNNVQTSATIPSRTYFNINANGGTKNMPRAWQIHSFTLTNFGHGFSVNSKGYFESQNKGVNNSYSMLKLQFIATANASFTIRYISYAENNFDYAIFGNLDQALSESYNADTTYYKRTHGEASPTEKSVTYYDIPSGTHNIYIKFRKDGSNHQYNDSLQLFFESDCESGAGKYQYNGLMYGTLPTATRSGYEFGGWWTDANGGERITETSIYKGQAIYAHWDPLKITFNSNGGMINNMSLWKKYYNGSQVSISYNGTTAMNSITINGVGGWEIVGCPVEVDRNTSYSFTFDYSIGDFATSDNFAGIYFQVATEIYNGNLQDNALTNCLITKNTSGTKTISFNSGSYSTLYLVLNGGYFADGTAYTINIGNFCRETGNVFNMLGEAEVSNSSSLNSQIYANSAAKVGYNLNGWKTSGYSNQGYQIYNSSGNFVSLTDNNYLNNLNNWTKNFLPDTMSTSYNSSTKMSTFTVKGVGGWEILSRTISVSTNTTYTLSFDFKAGVFHAPNADEGQRLDGLPLMVVHNLGGGTGGTNGDLQAFALQTSVIYSGSSGRRTITFNSGSYTTLYIVLNGGYLQDGTSYSIEIGNFYLTGNSISQVTNSFWNSNGTWKYHSGITAWAQYTAKTYTISLSWGSGISSVSGGGTYSYGSSVSISASVSSGYSFARWSDGNTSATRTISNLQSNWLLTAYATPNIYTVTYDANGGTTPLSSTQIAYNDLYGKKNVYDATRCVVEGPLSRSGNIFTVNYANTSSGWQWGNFNQRFSNLFRPNTKYTVVYECLSFSGDSFGVTLTSPDDEGEGGKTDISNTGQCHVQITGVGVYTSSFTSKSSFTQSNLYHDFRSYVAIGSGKSVNATFRVSLFVGDVLFDRFSYASYGSMPTGNLMPTPTRSYYTFDGWYTEETGGTKVTASTTFATVGNQTLYARWIPVSRTIDVHLRVIQKDGSYVEEDNSGGGSVSVNRYVISGSTSLAQTRVQTEKNYSYVVHSGQRFQITATANSGYAFVGFSTSSTPSDTIKNPTITPSPTSTYYPTGNTHYYAYFKQLSGNQLQYDETDKYFYFEDGYYPQSDANILTLKPKYSSGTSVSGVTLTYLSDGSVVVNGSLTPFSTTHVLLTDVLPFPLKQGTNVVSIYEKISGSVSGSGEACWSTEVVREDGLNVSERNFVDKYNNFSENTEQTSFQINASGASEGKRLRIQIYCTGSFTFSNLRFKIRLEYDRDDISAGAVETGETLQITQPFQTDMRNWKRYHYGSAFDSITYNSSTKINTIKVTGVKGWEIIGVPIDVQKNTEYKLSFDYNGGTIDSLNEEHNGLPVMVVYDLSNGEDPYGDLKSYALATTVITPSATSGTRTMSFNSGNYSRLYVVVNCGWLADYKTHTINIGNFKLSGGEVSSDMEIPVYTYQGEKYVKVSARGETKWFKFEPIRWRISDYGVEKTERNIARYSTLLSFGGFASYNSNFTAVSDLILGVGAMHNTREVDENRKTETGALDGTYSIHMAGFQNVENATNGCDLGFNYSANQSMIDVERYGHTETGDGNAVYNSADNGWYHPYSSPLRIASIKELETIGFVSKQARASDMVAFILGTDNDQVSYWTRDLSNLGAGVAITPTGTEIRPWLDEVLGMRFAYTFREGSAAGGNLIYNRLSYIQTNGTQWINTGFKPNQDTTVEMGLAGTEQTGYWFGAWNQSYKDGAYAFCNDEFSTNHGLYVGYGNQGGTLGAFVSNGNHVVRQDKNVSYVDGVAVRTYTYNTFQLNYNLYLFAQNRKGETFIPESDSGIKCTYCKIWDNGVLVRDFVPVQDVFTKEVGLWDNVSKTFYGNCGTGAFLIG